MSSAGFHFRLRVSKRRLKISKNKRERLLFGTWMQENKIIQKCGHRQVNFGV
jgi:hypothetical protein